MAGSRNPCVLRCLHSHGRALSEGAVEDEALSRCGGKLVQNPTWADILLEVRVGSVKGAGDSAVLLAFARFAEVNEHNIRLAEEFKRLSGADRPAAPCDLLLDKPDMLVCGHRHVHHLRDSAA